MLLRCQSIAYGRILLHHMYIGISSNRASKNLIEKDCSLLTMKTYINMKGDG